MSWQSIVRRAQAEPIPTARLQTALRASWPDVEVTGATPLRGGLASVLHRVHVRGAPVATVVLRQLLVELGNDAATARREMLVHTALSAQGLCVPGLHWGDPTGDVLGRPALVLDDMPGRLLCGDLHEAGARDAFAGVVTRLAAAPVALLDGLPVLEDPVGHVMRFGEPPPSTLVDGDRISDAVATRTRWFRPRRQLVHCDLHAGNVLWDGVAVTGVLDWPGAAIGNALSDEAYAWMDTVLAHGRATGDALRTAMDARRRGPAPSAGEVALWNACALHRALPTPAPWAEGFRAAGVDVTDELVEERFVALVDDELGRT